MQSYYLQKLNCSSLHVSSETHASTGTTTVLFLINAVIHKELSQPNISEALFSLGKWWTVESKRCVGICWFTLPFRKKLSSLKCVLCALIKINYIALKSKIFWFNKHFFQQKVSLLDNLQMFDLVLIQNCLHCHCNGRNSCSNWECSQQKPSSTVLFHHLPGYLKLMWDHCMVLRICVCIFLRATTQALNLTNSLASQSPSLVHNSGYLRGFQKTGWVDSRALKCINKHT